MLKEVILLFCYSFIPCLLLFLGSVVSWSSWKEVGSHKRSHDLLSISHEPPPKRTKTGNDANGITLPILLESVSNEDVASGIDILQAEVIPPMDLSSPIIAKLKGVCSNTASLDDKQIILLWEELTSVRIDQVYNYIHFRKSTDVYKYMNVMFCTKEYF